MNKILLGLITLTVLICSSMLAFSISPSTTVDLGTYNEETINLFIGDEVHANNVYSESDCDKTACDGYISNNYLTIPTTQKNSNCTCDVKDIDLQLHTITMNIQPEPNGSMNSPNSDVKLIALDGGGEEGVLI